MAKKIVKTNAVRIVEQQKIEHELLYYETDNGQAIDGETVAQKTSNAHIMYKILKATRTIFFASSFFLFIC